VTGQHIHDQRTYLYRTRPRADCQARRLACPCAHSVSVQNESHRAPFRPSIRALRSILDEVMSKAPADQVTPAAKARMAEAILKAAGNGQTSYEDLLGTANRQLNRILAAENRVRKAIQQ
jgi:hypothetical protein